MALSEKRKGRVTGSQAGAILGLCPWRSREQVMQDWLHGAEFTGNVATEHGNFYEEHAIADLSLEIDRPLQGQDDFWVSPMEDWLGATPDVIVDGQAIAEIKCPYGMRKETNGAAFKSINDQPHYYAQVQIELHCTGREFCWFYQWSPAGGSKLEKVHYNGDWLAVNLPKLKAFYDEYQERKARMEKEASNIDYLGEQYLAAKAKLDKAKAEMDAIRELMIEHAQGNKTKYGTVTCTPTERKGSISYSKVVKEHLPALDLEPYRGKPSTVWTIK